MSTGAQSEGSDEAPLVSVIVPCFNDGMLLTEALGSISEDVPVEIIVVDDGSTDAETERALDIVEGDVTLIRHGENRGVSAARNTALAASRGEFVVPLDADDLLVEGILEQFAGLLMSQPAATVAYGDYLEFDADGPGLTLRRSPERIDGYRIVHVNEYPPLAMFRRQILVDLGGWRRVGDTLDAHSDWGLWMTLAEHEATGVHIGAEKITYLHREHGFRLAKQAREHHLALFEGLKRNHSRLFSERGLRRRTSDLGPIRRTLYPIVYGQRSSMRPLARRIRDLLDRFGIWSPQYRLGEAETETLHALVRHTRARAASRYIDPMSNTEVDERERREREFHDRSYGEGVYDNRPARRFYSVAAAGYRYYEQRICDGVESADVLEYGCGQGSYAFMLAERGARVTGIDISGVAIEIAQKQAVDLEVDDRTSFQVMNAEVLEFPDDSFDLICGGGILHHIDLEKGYAEISRTLRPGGRAVFLEALGHNPLINAYRNRTPEQRTEDEHPLLMDDVAYARSFFGQVDCNYFNLATIGAFPFAKAPGFDRLVAGLNRVDQAAFKHLPRLRKHAWMLAVELSEPLER